MLELAAVLYCVWLGFGQWRIRRRFREIDRRTMSILGQIRQARNDIEKFRQIFQETFGK